MNRMNRIKLILLSVITLISGYSNGQDYVNIQEVICSGNKYNIVSQNNLKGVLGENDTIIIPIKYEFIHKMKPCIFMTTNLNNKYGLYASNGNELLKTEFDGIYSPFIDTKDDNLLTVTKEEYKTLYLYDNSKGLIPFIKIDNNKYKLNFLEHRYFKSIKEGEILFCVYNIKKDLYEKFYLFNNKKNWINVTNNKIYYIPALKYYNREIEIEELEKDK